MGQVIGVVGFFGLFVFLVMLIIALVKKKEKKTSFVGLLICLALFIVGMAITPDSDSSSTQQGAASSTSAISSTSASSQSSASEKVYTADVDSLKQLFLDTLTLKQDSLEVAWDDINKCYTVSYHPTDGIWDENDFVRTAITNYILYCQKAYLIDNVSCVDFEVSTEMKDSYGKTSVENVLSIRMPKENFDKFDWENLEYQGIYDNFKANCSFFWIAPGILQNIDASKIYYAP